MKNAAQHTKALGQLLGKLASRVPKEPHPQLSPVEQLIAAFMEWDSSSSRAHAAYQRLMSYAVDLNDLRVTEPADLAAVIGPGYPKSLDRAQRLRSVLNTIYRREHSVDLSSLVPRPKKEVRAYLDSLDGMVPYVSSAVTLLSFGGHAIPLDNQLHRKLIEDGVIEPDATFEETQAFLDHHIRFEDALEAHQRLRAYVDAGAAPSSTAKRPTRKATTKRKKPTKRAGSRR